jgi:hypothetical protein
MIRQREEIDLTKSAVNSTSKSDRLRTNEPSWNGDEFHVTDDVANCGSFFVRDDSKKFRC